MPQVVIKTPDDAARLYARLGQHPMPFTVSWVKGEKRSNEQNRTVNMWYGEIARQLGDVDAQDVRAQCKLEVGVPILRRDDVAFKADYDAMFRPLPYEHKITLFKRLEPAVTSIMSTGQLKEYMDEIQRRYAQAGVRLTDPEARKHEAMA